MIARNIYFYDTLINFVRKLGDTISVVKLGDSDGHVGSNREEYLHHLGGYDYEVIKIEDGKVLIFHAAMNMTVGHEKRIRVI